MKKYFNLQLFETDAQIIDRSGAESLIPEDRAAEIIQGAIAQSAVLSMGRRLANMTAAQTRLPVLDALPIAYFVNGDTGQKKTTRQAWDKKTIIAEEIAVIVPIPEAVLDDADYDIWGEVRPRIQEAFGQVIDAAILFGTDKPATWREGLVPSATTAGAVKQISADLYTDLLGEGGIISKVEESGYFVSGHVADIGMRAKLRGLKDGNERPLFLNSMQQAGNYTLDGSAIQFPRNGAFDKTKAHMISGDFSQLVYSIRQDITFKLFTEGVVQNTDGTIAYNLMQNDMVALRAVMRLGWEIANPVNAYNVDKANPFPFSVYGKGGAISTVAVTPATATVKKGESKLFTAKVDGEGIINGEVEWSQDGTKSNISDEGVLTVSATETKSSITVTAKSKQDGTKTGTATVTVSG